MTDPTPQPKAVQSSYIGLGMLFGMVLGMALSNAARGSEPPPDED